MRADVSVCVKQWENIFAGRRCGNEVWQRRVCACARLSAFEANVKRPSILLSVRACVRQRVDFLNQRDSIITMRVVCLEVRAAILVVPAAKGVLRDVTGHVTSKHSN